MNIPRAIIGQLLYGVGPSQTLGELVHAIGKPRHKIADWLDQLILDGAVTTRQRLVYPGDPDSPVLQCYVITVGGERTADEVFNI